MGALSAAGPRVSGLRFPAARSRLPAMAPNGTLLILSLLLLT